MRWIVLSFVLTVGCASQSHPTVHGLINFAQVDNGVYRSGQPGIEGEKYLVEEKAVWQEIKLNTTPNDPAIKDCFSVVWYPIPWYRQILLQPSLPDLERLAYVVKPGTEINCAHGQDRTGLFVAIYRVLVDHWTCAAAEKEMIDNGFHKSLLSLWGAWERFKLEQGQ